MPELPDITLYIEALEVRITGQRVERVDLRSPFLLRSVEPPLAAVLGREVRTIRRIGKRIAIGLSHAEACTDGSPHPERYRQRLFGRNPASGAAFADHVDAEPRA